MSGEEYRKIESSNKVWNVMPYRQLLKILRFG